MSTNIQAKLNVNFSTSTITPKPSNIASDENISLTFAKLYNIIGSLGNSAFNDQTSLIYSGTIGTTGATITTLPSASASNKGYCYRVITNGVGTVNTSKVGDWYISDGTAWNLISFCDVDAVTQAVITELTTGGTAVPEATHATSAESATTAESATYATSAGSANTATTADALDVNGTAVGSASQPVYFSASGVPTPITNTIQSNVPQNAVFTDVNVTQTPTSTNSDYEILFSGTADNTAHTEGVGKNNNLTFNPSTGTLSATSFNGSIASASGLTETQVTTALGYTPGTSNFDGAFSSLSGKPTTIGGYGITDASISNGVVTLGSNTITPLTSSDVTSTYSSSGTDPVNGAAVASALETLPKPMVYKGTVGAASDNPTITALPVDGTATVGDTYKVITDGTYASQAAIVGDIFICKTKTSDTNTWNRIPSGDDVTSAVTSIGAGTGLVTNTGSAITSTGTIKANLKSEIASALESTSMGSTASRQYAVGVDTDGYLSVNIPWTDTSVTSVSNHYEPQTDSSANINVDASSSTPATWGTTALVTGVNVTRDEKGHITGLTVDSIQIPDNPNTDRYVNSATFSDDSTNSSSSPVKMTLTRAGSDSTTVTANIPKVSSSSAGVVPKGNTVSTQSTSTQFLREDGSWAAPSYPTNQNAISGGTADSLVTTGDKYNWNNMVSTVSYNTSGVSPKLQKTIDGVTTDVFTCDTTMTQNSTNPITSGAVYSIVGDINSVLESVL